MNEHLARSVEAMAFAYPQLVFRRETTAVGEMGVWRGVVHPMQSLNGINDALDDLAHGRVVRVVAGEVRHHRECSQRHCHHDWMERLVHWRIPFEVEVWYDGGCADPKCWVIWPPVSTLHKRKHTWGDGSICPFLSSDGWDCHHDDVVDFMGHVAVWLVKWTLWDQTGVWIGPEHLFSPEHHLGSVHPTDQCWCRSGLPYRCCHLQRDRAAAATQRSHVQDILNRSRA